MTEGYKKGSKKPESPEIKFMVDWISDILKNSEGPISRSQLADRLGVDLESDPSSGGNRDNFIRALSKLTERNLMDTIYIPKYIRNEIGEKEDVGEYHFISLKKPISFFPKED